MSHISSNSKNKVQHDTVEGRRVWITGGCGHLGHLAVQNLLQDGAEILCADLPAAVEKSTLAHPRFKLVALDAFDLPAIGSWVNAQIAGHGAPDAFIHLPTGSSRGKSFDELGTDDLEKTFHDSLTAGFSFVRSVGEHMAQAGRGSIVLFSSMYGLVAPDASMYGGYLKPNPLDYGVAKAGVVQMTKYCAMQFGRRGVRVNCIAPGAFPNPTVQQADPDFLNRLSVRTMLGRIGQPEEMVGPLRFLVSDASSYMTGQCLVIDGGWTAW